VLFFALILVLSSDSADTEKLQCGPLTLVAAGENSASQKTAWRLLASRGAQRAASWTPKIECQAWPFLTIVEMNVQS
jgi:hypothetical protein